MSSFTALDFLGEASLINTSENSKKLDIELMIYSLLNLDRINLHSNPPLITDEQRMELFSMISRRNKGEPLAYILGNKGFWNMDFVVNEHVLIPRPETETMIEKVLERFGELPLTILDAGTGCGAIALILANERKQWLVLANDKSKKALQIAKKNKQILKIPVNFLISNWLEPFGKESFDLIVSNPPYIEENNPCLEEDGIKYEPLSALVSKGDGLDDLKEIIVRSYICLKRGGHLFLEHAPWQTIEIKNFLFESNFISIEVFNDLNGDQRISTALKP